MKSPHRLFLTVALTLIAAISAGVAMLPDVRQQEPPAAQAMPPMPPAPGEHHKWLEQLVGTWTIEGEMTAPGMDPVKSTGTDSVRSIGGRWVVGDLTNNMPGMGPVTAIYAIGYDAEKGNYHGTWIDSMHDILWVYTGTVDATGKILTLEAEGPNMVDPAGGAGPTKYRDVIEIKSPTERTMTSSALGPDGKWVQFGVTTYRKGK